jgi:hypothetical protein
VSRSRRSLVDIDAFSRIERSGNYMESPEGGIVTRVSNSMPGEYQVSSSITISFVRTLLYSPSPWICKLEA